MTFGRSICTMLMEMFWHNGAPKKNGGFEGVFQQADDGQRADTPGRGYREVAAFKVFFNRDTMVSEPTRRDGVTGRLRP